MLAVFAYGELFPVCFHPGLAQVLIQRAPAIEGLPGAVTGGPVRLQARRSQGQQGGVDGGGLHQMRTMFQQTGIQLGLGEGGIVEHPAQEGGVMVDALQLQGVQCLNQLLPGGVAVCAVTDQLGDHGIVVFVHAIALFVARIDSALIVGPAQVAQQAGGGQEPLFRVFRIETDFHGGAMALDLLLLFGQRLSRCHGQLPGHQVFAGDHLGDRVLYLQAGVHFHEKELSAVSVAIGRWRRIKEFHRAGATIINGFGGLHCGMAEGVAGGLVQTRCRRFFNDFLVAALYRTIAFKQVNSVAMVIGKHLHFHMAGGGQIALQQHPIVTKGVTGFAAGGGQGFIEFLSTVDHAHALATAAGHGLDQ